MKGARPVAPFAYGEEMSDDFWRDSRPGREGVV